MAPLRQLCRDAATVPHWHAVADPGSSTRIRRGKEFDDARYCTVGRMRRAGVALVGDTHSRCRPGSTPGRCHLSDRKMLGSQRSGGREADRGDLQLRLDLGDGEHEMAVVGARRRRRHRDGQLGGVPTRLCGRSAPVQPHHRARLESDGADEAGVPRRSAVLYRFDRRLPPGRAAVDQARHHVESRH